MFFGVTHFINALGPNCGPTGRTEISQRAPAAICSLSIRIDVDDRAAGDGETVRIRVPIRVVDALFSGEGDELNLRDALEELKDERGEIVHVEGPDEDVRIWIDERSGK